jgi:uncharacterized YigZ family protein
MAQDYLVPAQETRNETIVSNSRFIAILAPVFSIDEAKTFIQRVRQEFQDASHHVTAYIIGYPPSETSHCSDAGEPSGTAGRPALTVLRGSGMGDIAVVVVRYFGGTKLGTGGLVRAYSDAVKMVVDLVPKTRLVKYKIYRMEIPYSFFDKVARLVHQFTGELIEKEFGVNVSLTIQIEAGQEEFFIQSIKELGAGKFMPGFICEISAQKPI